MKKIQRIYVISNTETFTVEIDNGYFRILIPHYQRAYQWTPTIYNTFLYELIQAIKNEKEQSYIGTITLGETCFRGKKYLVLIDGQQRIISLILTSYVLYDILKTHNEHGKIDELLTERYNIPNLEWVKVNLDKNWGDKRFVYENHKKEDKKILDNLYNGHNDLTRNTTNNGLTKVIETAYTVLKKEDTKTLIELLLSFIDFGETKIKFSPVVYKNEEDAVYLYYDEYRKINVIQKEFDKYQNIKISFQTICNMYDLAGENASLRIDEIFEKYFDKNVSLFETFFFNAFWRSTGTFKKTYNIKYIEDYFKGKKDNSDDSLRETLKTFYDNVCGEGYLKRFFEILNITKTFKDDPVWKTNASYAHLMALQYTHLNDYSDKARIFYPIYVIDRIMDDCCYGSKAFKSDVFKNRACRFIEMLLLMGWSSDMIITSYEKFAKEICLHGSEYIETCRLYQITKQLIRSIITKFSTHEKPCTPQHTNLLLAIDSVATEVDWGTKLSFMLDHFLGFENDHFFRKREFRKLTDEEIETKFNMDSHSYRTLLNSIGNFVKNTTDGNIKDYDSEHTSEPPTPQAIDDEIERKITNVLHSPFFEHINI